MSKGQHNCESAGGRPGTFSVMLQLITQQVAAGRVAAQSLPVRNRHNDFPRAAAARFTTRYTAMSALIPWANQAAKEWVQ